MDRGSAGRDFPGLRLPESSHRCLSRQQDQNVSARDLGWYPQNSTLKSTRLSRAEHAVTVIVVDGKGEVTQVSQKSGINPPSTATPSTAWPFRSTLTYYTKRKPAKKEEEKKKEK